MILRPQTERCDADFLAYYLRSPAFRNWSRGAQGINIKNIRKVELERLPVSLPSLDEQRRIVELLNRAAGIRRLREAALSKAREAIPALFLSMFGDPATNPMGWPVVTLGELVREFRYGTSTKCTEAETAATLPVLRIPNVIGDAVDWSDLKFAPLYDRERAKLLLRRGDLLFVRTNGNPAYIGRAVVFSGVREAAFASYLIRARLVDGDTATAIYIREAVSCSSYRDNLLRAARTTAGNYNISIDGLSGLRLPLPPTDLRQLFEVRLADLRGIIAQQERALGAAKEMEAALLHRLLD